ncbi:hypothetical protein IMX26_06760 [Clostridium sp. 'deep sea']|uniref:hypothetical protein n=1 Tax=Clostridium sp. 'deep sea' TaxID=2779445 RepID=UPI00189643DE|nr:hypothetical protein [Clostridium sp. 'deep sea']QOR36505.1 hypothetical protein IMX26_06760 [Clostridium sp. 'deep sea']
MRNVTNKIEKVHYTSYVYGSIDEKNKHILEMQKNGYEFLVNFQDEHRATFRKFL